jgi:ATP-dependent Lon protease
MSFKGEWEVEVHYVKGDIIKIPTYKYFDGYRIQNGQKYFVCIISHISCNLVYPSNPDEIYWCFLSNIEGLLEINAEINSEYSYEPGQDDRDMFKINAQIAAEIEKEIKKQEKKEYEDTEYEDTEYEDPEFQDPECDPVFQEYYKKYYESKEVSIDTDADADADANIKDGSIPQIIITEEEILKTLRSNQTKRKFRTKLNEIQQEIRVYKKQKGDVEYDLEDKIMLLDVDIQTKVFLLDKYESTVKNAKLQSGSDYTKSVTWFKTATNIPFGKYKPFKIRPDDSPETINLFFENVKSKLDEKIYGLDYVKEEILEFLARKITNPSSKGHILALHGIAGTGKTKILKTLANALELPFHQINFGGMGDASILTGHSETYISSKPGKIAEILTNSGYMNPIIYLDEIDKISESKQREINGVLTHMLDEEQNNKFQDNYLSNIDIDLSQVFFVIAFNDLSKVNSIVSDRMKIIDIKIPTIEDKIIIASKKMIPEIIDTLKIKTKIIINDDLIRYIMLNKVNNEGGVRQMKKIFEKLFNRINYLLLIGKMERNEEHTISKEFVDNVIVTNCKEDQFHNLMYS